MISAIIFDCFGVFYPDPVFEYMQWPSTPPNNAAALHDIDTAAALGEITKSKFVEQAAIITGFSKIDIEKIFFHGRRNEELVTLVKQLKRHYKIALLSNIGGDMMDGFFTAADYQALFDVVILSGDHKVAKPDPRIFQLTCNKLEVPTNQVVMIDDMQSNIDAAAACDMQGICYQSFIQCKPELETMLEVENGF